MYVTMPRQLAWSLVKDHDVKAVVVACNTAAAAGLELLRAELPVPVLDVIGPGAAALVEASDSGRVGVIGTVGTVASGAYLHAVEGRQPGPASTSCSSRRPAQASSSSSSAGRRPATR